MTSLERSVVIATFFVSLAWAVTIPVWHFPDEQAHFAQVQDYAELKQVPMSNDLSLEIAETERLLGTNRDERGRNKYTPVPGYQLPLSQTRFGYDEFYLANLNPAMRTTMVGREAPHYPPLYYILGSFAYQQILSGSIFDRLFIVRLASVILMTCMSYAALLVGRSLFPRHPSLQWATMILTSLHPMMVFVGSGVNNDILMDLICTLLIAKSLQILTRPVGRYDVLQIMLLLIAGMLTKQLVFLLIPTIMCSIGYSWYRYHFTKKGIMIALASIVLVGVVFVVMKQFNQGFWLPYWPAMPSLSHYLPAVGTVIIRLYKETFAWYWGVYRWLGLVSPLWVLRVFKYLLILIGYAIGRYIWFHRTQLKQEKYIPWYVVALFNLTYIGALIAWEAASVANLGFGHGLQGRYFFPLIATHMAIICAGIYIVSAPIIKKYVTTIISIVWSCFSVGMWWYVMGAYYQRHDWRVFVTQLSQYKPEIAKWPTILLFLLASLMALIVMNSRLIRQQRKDATK
jgi:hypothetical protein